jgi:hypothetical protein
MSDDILSMYGKDTSQPMAGQASSGGVKSAKPLAYSPPMGPKGQMQEGPGLHGDNCGNCGTQGS